jgi:sec-independent protein translocase protein TatA
MSLGAPELLILLAIVFLLFGATRLPKLARSLGQASKEFKDGVAEGSKDAAGAATATATAAADKVTDKVADTLDGKS